MYSFNYVTVIFDINSHMLLHIFRGIISKKKKDTHNILFKEL